MQITDQRVNEFVEFLFGTLPFKQINGSNQDGLKNIYIQLIKDLYTHIPEDVINFLEKNASDYFLDILYREAGISDYHIKKVPQNLKVRISYLLNNLNINRSTQAVFRLFHEAIEEFFPKLNIYLIEIAAENLKAGVPTKLIYRLEPRYITDPDNLLTEIDGTDISDKFLMRPEQFVDREEKFTHLYPDYKAKRRTINIFPIKTGIIYVQNPNGLGHADPEDYIPLMQTIGASKQQFSMIPWKINTTDKRKLINFQDFIKLCTYLKYKEFEFKSQYSKPGAAKWTWETQPLETYRDETLQTQWELALLQSENNGIAWNKFFTAQEQKLNDFLLDASDLAEAERLETVYKGLKRSGKYNGYRALEQFKTDWNTLRQKSKNTSIRLISNQDEFREELVGSEPHSINELEMLILMNFTSSVYGEARDNILKVKKIYKTDPENTKGSKGLITLVNKFYTNVEFNKFIFNNYKTMDDAPLNEQKLLIDLFEWYSKTGTIPLLKNYSNIIKNKFPELINIDVTNELRNNRIIYNKVYSELTNSANSSNFIELNTFVKIKYRDIVESIDKLKDLEDVSPEDFTAIFLLLWKLIQTEIPDDKRVRYFWNEFFMRHIMGSTFKDFFYDPIMDMFLEYWFPAECTTQNKDIQTILIKDKMQTIPLESKMYSTLYLNKTHTIQCKDQHKITIFNETNKVVYDYLFKEIKEPDTTITII